MLGTLNDVARRTSGTARTKIGAMASSIAVSTVLPAGIEAAWQKVSDLSDHVNWMADAHSIEFEGELRSGVGTVMQVLTKVGPLQTIDRIEVTDWEEQRRIAVDHRGLVRGTGEFRLEPISEDETQFTWEESLTFPWYLGGPVTAYGSRPVLAWIWKRNLERLRSQF